MALNVRNRVPAVNVLQTDYEYCTISYYTEGTRNDFGEPTRTLTERAANIRCSIDPLNQTPSHIRQSGLRDILRQGLIERSVYIMTLITMAKFMMFFTLSTGIPIKRRSSER